MEDRQLANLNQTSTEPHAGGRPTKKTDFIVNILVDCFKEGVSDTTACQQAKISRQTFYNWMSEDVEFFDLVTAAKNFQKFLATQRVNSILARGEDRDAGPMARWLLEKKEPEVYGATPSLVINQNFQYRAPSWFVAPSKVSEARIQTIDVNTHDAVQTEDRVYNLE